MKEGYKKTTYWGVRWYLIITYIYVDAYLFKGVEATGKACFASVVSRGLGSPLESCPVGKTKDGLLCYTSCKSGYHGVGPLCYQSCPPNYKDIGLICTDIYWKHCCCTVFGCCGCRPDYKNHGCFCSNSFTKHIYGRGAGKPTVCSPGKEQSGSLCYKSCSIGYHGVGPICWGQHSPIEFPFKCNDYIWALDQSTCDTLNTDLTNLGVSSAACAGVVFTAIVSGTLWPLVPEVCHTSISNAISTVQHIISSTRAKNCP